MYHIPQRRRLSKDSKWVTISDLKIQAVKEICYEVALNDFQHSRQEIEALAIVKMKELCAMYGKKDPNERDSWRAVARDVWDTVGVGDEKIEDVVPVVKGTPDVDDLKVHVDKLEDILQEVKNQNNMKDVEIKALRNKMLKMEKVLPLMGPQGKCRQRGSSTERDKDTESDKSTTFEHNEEQVYQQTDSDAVFNRGRTQWMRQEQVKFKNLQQQEIAKQLRRNNGPHRFIPPENRKPRFPFKSNPSHRSSWSPGTHIIITNDKVIEVKVPKEAELQEQEEEVEPEKQIWSPFSHLRNQHLTSQQYRGNGNNNNNDNTLGRWRSNSLNGYQKGLRRQASGSSESLQTSDLKQTDSQYLQQQPPPGYQQRQQNWENHYGSGNEGSNTSYNKQADRPHYHNQFVTPPRMRRQYSAPNLKSGRETTV